MQKRIGPKDQPATRLAFSIASNLALVVRADIEAASTCVVRAVGPCDK
jgi:hypothetical protein